jgi:hypothetical protein
MYCRLQIDHVALSYGHSAITKLNGFLGSLRGRQLVNLAVSAAVNFKKLRA